MRDVCLMNHGSLVHQMNNEEKMLFPLHIVNKVPAGSSLAVIQEGEIEGFAISGLPFGINEVPSYWAFADEPSALGYLIKTLRSESSCIFVNFDEQYSSELQKIFPEGEYSTNGHYKLEKTPDATAMENMKVIRLDSDSLTDLNVHHVLKKLIGNYDNFTAKCPFWGVVDQDNKLVAIGEAFVRSDNFASIQQIYCHKPHRKKGIASFLVCSIARELRLGGLTPTILVNDDNKFAIKMVEQIGFTRTRSFGYLKLQH